MRIVPFLPNPGGISLNLFIKKGRERDSLFRFNQNENQKFE